MKRRDLFKLGVGKAAEAAGRLAGQKLALRRRTWLRPPFAEPELAFLLACTRCDACIEACEFEVLFRLPAAGGRPVAGSPAMDLLNRGCHMCADWPCVTACEPQALRLPQPADGGPPVPGPLSRVRIDPDTCLPYAGPECGACADSCPVPGALEWEDGVRPVVNQERCTGCALCREACIVDPKAVAVSALVGDAEEAAEVP
jgi:ferredoxin-type protein NapG